MVHRAIAVMLVACCAQAQADGVVIGGRSAHTIGRAGAGTISDDGGGALLVNPAAIARRHSARAQFGLAYVDDEIYWLHSDVSPPARDLSSSRLLPLVGLEVAIGDWVVGATATTSAHSERWYRRPDTLPPRDLGNTFEYRYTGMIGAFRRDTASIGGARLLGDNVALGIAVAASRVAVSEQRRVWAGLQGRGTPPEQIGDPRYDVELAFDAADEFVPSAVAGVLVAPEDSRIELAASLGWSAPARTAGTAAGVTIGSEAMPVTADVAPARLAVEQPLSLRTGARYLGERFAIEVGGDLWIFAGRAQSTSWLTDLHVTDMTTLGAPRLVEIGAVPSRLSSRTHGALRGAVDIELISGFLWATAGYAYATAGTPRARLSPTFGDLGGHTLALGLEATAGGFTTTLGWARTWSVKEEEPFSRWQLDNPFGTGDAPVPAGTYDGSTDMLGISVDIDFDPD